MKKVLAVLATAVGLGLIAPPAQAVVDDDGQDSTVIASYEDIPIDPETGMPVPGDYTVEPTAEEQADMNARAVKCTLHWSTDYKDVFGGTGSHIQVGTDVHYGHCSGGGYGNHWIDPRIALFKCRHSGGPDQVQQVHFNIRAWDYDAPQQVWNPGDRTQNCEATTPNWREIQQDSPTVQHMHRCSAGVPRWRVDGKTDIRLTQDHHWTLSSTLWGFSGPVSVNC